MKVRYIVYEDKKLGSYVARVASVTDNYVIGSTLENIKNSVFYNGNPYYALKNLRNAIEVHEEITEFLPAKVANLQLSLNPNSIRYLLDLYENVPTSLNGVDKEAAEQRLQRAKLISNSSITELGEAVIQQFLG